ncbi:YbaK/EbsC family protein [Rhizobium lusitanum]|uniref:YbaK/EbsC family protein n=1 Tax=Rhizobium lusitanum TaxID=293958 RepID=UPI0025730127|nr:YbaK/EbsC family protein [Rhizobium lusitanum]
MFGKPIRRRYLEGGGVLAFIDVMQDASSNALEKTLCVAKAVGFTREGVVPVSFDQETELDLFQEQFLTPLLIDAFRMAFEILVENGYDPVASFLDTCGSGEMAEMLMEAVNVGLFEVIEQQGSPTCRYGVQKYLNTLINASTKAKGKMILDDIRNGAFQAELTREAQSDYPSLEAYRATSEASELTKTHVRLKKMLGTQKVETRIIVGDETALRPSYGDVLEGALICEVHDRIVGILDSNDARYEMIKHEAEGRTEAVAELRGTPVSHSGKAILCKLKGGGRTEDYVLAVVAGDRRVDMKALARKFGGTAASFASSDDVIRLTGCVPGAVPPFAPTNPLPLVVDAVFVEENSTIAFNAGRLDRSITMEMRDYLRIFQPQAHEIGMA